MKVHHISAQQRPVGSCRSCDRWISTLNYTCHHCAGFTLSTDGPPPYQERFTADSLQITGSTSRHYGQTPIAPLGSAVQSTPPSSLVMERTLVLDSKDLKHLGFFREKKLESQVAGSESFFPQIILGREKGREVL